MKKLLFIAITIAAISACTNKTSVTTNHTQETEKVYQNEYFSINYPSSWSYDVEENEISDTIPGLRKGIKVNISPWYQWQVVSVQKSAMFDVFETPEQWRDFSIEMKKFDDSYIAVVDSYVVDSLSFGDWPAAMAGFIAINELNDTIFHKQLVVMVNKQLYYLNNSFLWNAEQAIEQRGDAILSSVRFTDQNK